MKKLEQIQSVQKWLPYEKILEEGILKMKDSSYIKIIKIYPINYNLKSDLEKETILNSYTNLFKSGNLNFQILIQSKKEDLTNNIKKINNNNKYNNLKKEYIKYIKNLNSNRKSSNKNFYILIKENSSEKNEEIKIKNIKNNYLKIKDLISKCGNFTSEITKENQLKEILYSFLNSNKN